MAGTQNCILFDAGRHEHRVMAALLGGATPGHPIPDVQHLADRAQVICESQTKFPTLGCLQTACVQWGQLARCQNPPHMSCEPHLHCASFPDMKTQGDPAHRATPSRLRQQKSSTLLLLLCYPSCGVHARLDLMRASLHFSQIIGMPWMHLAVGLLLTFSKFKMDI